MQRLEGFDKDMDERFMKEALKLANRAFVEDEIPVGAVVVIQNRIVSRGYNQTELLKDPTAHAEMLALTSAFSELGSKYLPEATLYVTLEPCLMCAGALYWSKIGRIVWGAADVKNGHRKCTVHHSPFHPKTVITEGILAPQCAELMKNFFQQKR